MKRAFVNSGDHEGDESVLIVDLEELEFLVFAVGEQKRGAPGSVSDRLRLGLSFALEVMRAEASADGRA